jgi:hypothetical protein
VDLLSDVVLGGLIPSAFAAGASWTVSRAKDRLPERARWQLREPSRLTVCIARSSVQRRGAPVRPSTGLGQTLALSLVTPSLARAYPGINVPSLHFAEEVRDEVENDLILLGGPRKNRISAEIIKRLAASTGVDLTADELRIPGHDAIRHDEVPEPLTKDLGVVARVHNPWSASPRTLVLFAGVHTYGVAAAARYFVENVRPLRSRYRGDFVSVVCSDLRNGHVLPPREIYFAAVPSR